MKPYFLFIAFGILIDALQAGISGGFFILFALAGAAAPFAGTIVGALVGCVGGGLLGGLGGAIFAGFGAIPGAIAGCAAGVAGGGTAGGLLGAAAGVASIPTGTAFGFAADIGLSVTLGTMFITFLGFNNMWYPKYFMPGGITEIIPGLDILPAWTTIAILSVMRRYKEDKAAEASEAQSAEEESLALEENEEEPEVQPIPIRNPVDGIYAA